MKVTLRCSEARIITSDSDGVIVEMEVCDWMDLAALTYQGDLAMRILTKGATDRVRGNHEGEPVPCSRSQK